MNYSLLPYSVRRAVRGMIKIIILLIIILIFVSPIFYSMYDHPYERLNEIREEAAQLAATISNFLIVQLEELGGFFFAHPVWLQVIAATALAALTFLSVRNGNKSVGATEKHVNEVVKDRRRKHAKAAIIDGLWVIRDILDEQQSHIENFTRRTTLGTLPSPLSTSYRPVVELKQWEYSIPSSITSDISRFSTTNDNVISLFKRYRQEYKRYVHLRENLIREVSHTLGQKDRIKQSSEGVNWATKRTTLNRTPYAGRRWSRKENLSEEEQKEEFKRLYGYVEENENSIADLLISGHHGKPYRKNWKDFCQKVLCPVVYEQHGESLDRLEEVRDEIIECYRELTTSSTFAGRTPIDQLQERIKSEYDIYGLELDEEVTEEDKGTDSGDDGQNQDITLEEEDSGRDEDQVYIYEIGEATVYLFDMPSGRNEQNDDRETLGSDYGRVRILPGDLVECTTFDYNRGPPAESSVVYPLNQVKRIEPS